MGVPCPFSLVTQHQEKVLSREGPDVQEAPSQLCVLLLQGEVTIHYNKLQADPKQGMSLDIGKWARAGCPVILRAPALPCECGIHSFVAMGSAFF